jgi:hypothetical protein
MVLHKPENWCLHKSLYYYYYYYYYYYIIATCEGKEMCIQNFGGET